MATCSHRLLPLRQVLRGKPERRLLYIYLANDIMQNSKRKGNTFVEEFGAQLPVVMPDTFAACPERTREKLLRMPQRLRTLDGQTPGGLLDEAGKRLTRLSLALDRAAVDPEGAALTLTLPPTFTLTLTRAARDMGGATRDAGQPDRRAARQHEGGG